MYEDLSLYVTSVELATDAKPCQECHMPPRWSRLTQGHVLSLAHPRRMTRDHQFSVWTEELTRGAVEVSEVTVRRPSATRLAVDMTLVNRGAGHRIPTGEFGHRVVMILVEAIGQHGRVLSVDEWPLVAGYPDALPPGEAAKFPFDLPL